MFTKTAIIWASDGSQWALQLFEFDNVQEVSLLISGDLHLKALIPLAANHNIGPWHLLEAYA